MNNLVGKVCVITGASRGIGKCIALALASKGINIVIAAKSIKDNPKLPGTIYDVKREADELAKKNGHNVSCLAVKCDVSKENEVKEMIEKTTAYYGRIDILINNAGALWWKDMNGTPMERYDLINNINARGSFMCSKYALPFLKKNGGHIIIMSPPINLEMIPGKIAYCISKFGMTMITHGLSTELKGTGVSCNSLWPSSMIESSATKNFGLGNMAQWRKPDIIADCVLGIIGEDPNVFTGNCLIDEDYLRTKNVKDFSKYNCVEGGEPVKIYGEGSKRWNLSVGGVGDKSNYVEVRSKL
jgi:citronellol/citronellal dehydrogenase